MVLGKMFLKYPRLVYLTVLKKYKKTTLVALMVQKILKKCS